MKPTLGRRHQSIRIVGGAVPIGRFDGGPPQPFRLIGRRLSRCEIDFIYIYIYIYLFQEARTPEMPEMKLFSIVMSDF